MKILFVVLLLLLPVGVWAQSSVRYFGYYFNDANGSFTENHDHINLYNIQQMILGPGGTADTAATTKYMLGELAKAKAQGVRATISAAPFVFHWNNSTHLWSAEPNATANWTTLVNQLVASGYIVPGRPELSTVVAIYVVDEPNGTGLADTMAPGLPGTNIGINPDFANAVSIIRSNPVTSGIPLAAIITPKYNQLFDGQIFLAGMTLLDWVGVDWYGETQSDWMSDYNRLKSNLSPKQRTIIVPQAALGGDLGSSNYDDPNFFNNIFNTDPKVVWFTPFVWFSGSGRTGTRDIPVLKAAYTQIGTTIRTAACAATPAERGFCLGAAKKTAIISNLLLQ